LRRMRLSTQKNHNRFHHLTLKSLKTIKQPRKFIKFYQHSIIHQKKTSSDA
jgi:hypothetical protein